jgi:MFS family permease
MQQENLRAARVATTVVFFMTGFVIAAWGTRVPAIQERLALSPGEFAMAVLGLEAGAVIGLPTGGALCSRLGSRLSLLVGFSLYPTALFAATLAPGLAWLAASLMVMAAATSVVDVAMNVQGVELERRYRRPILSGLHAGHPFGMLVGALVGTAAAAADLSVVAHFAFTGSIGLVAGTAATRWLVTEGRRPGQPVLARPSGRLLLVGLVAFCAFLLDGTAYNWSAAHLHDDRAAGPAVAAAGFTAFTLALALGRLAGDRLIARFSRIRVVQASGLIAAVGSLLAITAADVPMTLAGWAVLGTGVAVVAPAVLARRALQPNAAARQQTG